MFSALRINTSIVTNARSSRGAICIQFGLSVQVQVCVQHKQEWFIVWALQSDL